jgi:group I intron endonuclease
MRLRFVDKTNHPMYGKTHNAFAFSQISKPGALNSMYYKKHTIEAKQKISLRLSKTPLSLYSTDNVLIQTFLNQVELAYYLKLNKSTIGRYLKSGKILLNKYYIRPTVKSE